MRIRDKWENICHGCGLCCHEKIIYGPYLLIDMDSVCEHLDRDTCRCRVYDRRFKISRRCRKVTLFRAMFASYLPDTCGYVQWARSHHIRFARHREVNFIETR